MNLYKHWLASWFLNILQCHFAQTRSIHVYYQNISSKLTMIFSMLNNFSTLWLSFTLSRFHLIFFVLAVFLFCVKFKKLQKFVCLSSISNESVYRRWDFNTLRKERYSKKVWRKCHWCWRYSKNWMWIWNRRSTSWNRWISLNIAREQFKQFDQNENDRSTNENCFENQNDFYVCVEILSSSRLDD